MMKASLSATSMFSAGVHGARSKAAMPERELPMLGDGVDGK
jgi:hypothetical protein